MGIYLVLILIKLPPNALDQVVERPALTCPMDLTGSYLDLGGVQ